MKVIERDTNFSIPLPHVHMPAHEFVAMICGMAEDGEVPEIILGDLYSPERLQLLGTEDIMAHQHLVSVPLTANVGSIRINLRHRWASLACQAQDAERAKRFQAAMAPHQPRSHILTHQHVFYVMVLLLLGMPVLLPAGNTLQATIIEQIITAGIAFVAWHGLKHFVARNILTGPGKHRPIVRSPIGKTLAHPQ